MMPEGGTPEMAKATRVQLSPQALLRYQLISAVQARVLAGMGVSRAVSEVVKQPVCDARGQLRRVSERSLYRWLVAYQQEGLQGLEPESRPHVAESAVLPVKLLNFLRTEKEVDREASIPEVIRRAHLRGILGEDEQTSRSTVWRACCRMGLPLGRVRKAADRDMRRFGYPHRMLMALADGKRFRAGVARLRRVALHILDDATRYGLAVVVGTAENTHLFLRGLHRTICRWGLMKAFFLDGGPGFISDDTRAVLARLNIKLIHGTANYPEGHGKVERFHWTAFQHELRGLDGNPEVDPDPSALELRLSHWLYQIYNHTFHESLGRTPHERWQDDPRELEFPMDRQWLDDQFVLTIERRVSPDNLIPYKEVDYELPRGYAGQKIQITRRLLDDTLSITHEGREVVLHPVDTAANAYARRARKASPPPSPPRRPPKTAAALAFESDYQPLVDHEGNYPKGENDD
jgi:transposase InsO family protein